MNILLVGPQGSGKGTQGKMLGDALGYAYLSSGDMLREIAEVHPEVDLVLHQGKLLPDEIALRLIEEYLQKNNIFDNVILDGTPRTKHQYDLLKHWFESKGKRIDLAIVLVISREESIKRLSGRRMDPITGEIYNLVTDDKPPAGLDLSSLVHREDDKPEAIHRRLDLYDLHTRPLIEEMKKDGIVVEVNGEQSIMDLHNELSNIVQKKSNL